MNRREYTTDRHGVAVMDRPAAEVFADEPETCPICNGRGFTWEQDVTDPDGGGYPETCPVAYQTPELHMRDDDEYYPTSVEVGMEAWD